MAVMHQTKHRFMEVKMIAKLNEGLSQLQEILAAYAASN